MSRKWMMAATLGLLGAAANAADVGVSIQISEPGIYGRVDIGRFPQPRVVVTQPVVVVPAPTRVVHVEQPVYMWVPRGHRKNWRKHCHRYEACGHPVVFVRHDWYQEQVMHSHPHGKRRGKGKHDD